MTIPPRYALPDTTRDVPQGPSNRHFQVYELGLPKFDGGFW